MWEGVSHICVGVSGHLSFGRVMWDSKGGGRDSIARALIPALLTTPTEAVCFRQGGL